MSTLSRLVQPSKASLPSDFTRLGTVMCFRLVQPSKAWSSILVSASGSSMAASDLQSWKALSPIVFTSAGSLMLDSSEQPRNALSPISVKLPSSFTCCKREQFLKTEEPNLIIFFGNSMEDRLLQPSKVPLPKKLTPDGIFSSSMLAQPSKAL